MEFWPDPDFRILEDGEIGRRARNLRRQAQESRQESRCSPEESCPRKFAAVATSE